MKLTIKSNEETARAVAVNKLADAAKTPADRMEVVRLALSSNVLGASITTPKDLAAFVAACWDQGINPLPAWRKRLGKSWIIVAHCYATHEVITPDDYVGDLFLEIPVNATGIQFRRVAT